MRRVPVPPGMCAFTVLELLMAAALTSVVLAMAWSLFGAFLGSRGSASNATTLTADSFLRQEARNGLAALTERLQDSIEILDPAPGMTARAIRFRDMLNDEVTVRVSADSVLVSLDRDGNPEPEPEPISVPGGAPFRPVKPIRVKGCTDAAFTAISPSCAVVLLTFVDEAGRAGSILNTIRLRNRNLARGGAEP